MFDMRVSKTEPWSACTHRSQEEEKQKPVPRDGKGEQPTRTCIQKGEGNWNTAAKFKGRKTKECPLEWHLVI